MSLGLGGELAALRLALRDARQRWPTVRGRVVQALAIDLADNGTGCLVAMLRPVRTLHALAVPSDDELVAPFADIGQLNRLLDGRERPHWVYHDEIVVGDGEERP